jgi:hypothetical protein
MLQKIKTLFISGIVSLNVIAIHAYLFALWLVIQDPTGMVSLVAFPLFLFVAIVFVPSALYFAIASSRLPKNEAHKKLPYRLYALAIFLAIAVPSTIVAANLFASNAAKQRAESPATLAQARQFVIDCKVDTLYRDEAASMKLKEKAFHIPFPGMTAPTESRIFDLAQFDEILNLALSPDVQNRCGFVPFYDAEYAKKPSVTRWITLAEAESMLKVCATQVGLDTTSGSYTMILPPGAGDGIELTQRHEVWNHEIVSKITTMGANGTIAQKLKDMRENCK